MNRLKQIGWLVFGVWAFLCTGSLYGQTRSISGLVRDESTTSPIMFCTVVIKGADVGTMTDENGKFFIAVKPGFDTLLFSYIGYATDTLVINNNPSQYYTIQLESSGVDLGAVVVKPREEPAKAIMRKVIENKKLNDPGSIDAYVTRSYNKMEIDLGNLESLSDEDTIKKNKKPAEPQREKKENPYTVLLDHIDTTSDETHFLPFFLTETVSDFYYRESPKARKEIILASRTSGINNASASQLLGNYYQQFNIYDNYWFLLNKNFIPPITDAWNFFYRVDLADSTWIGNDWCYLIRFSPKQPQENTFKGYMWIADGSFAVKEIYMELDSAVNINYCKRAHFYQSFEHYHDSVWVLKEDRMLVEFLPMKNSASFIGRRTSIYDNHRFHPQVFDEVAHIKDDIVYDDGVINNDESFWKESRPDSLNVNEAGVYELVDSLQNIRSFMTVVDVYNTLMYGYWNLGYVRLGPFANAVSSNTIEGLRFRVGGKTGDLISKRIAVGGYLAYGIDDGKFKYGADMNVVIAKKPWQEFKFVYFNDLDVANNESVTFGEDNLLSGFYRRRETPQKIVDMEKLQWTYTKDWFWGLSNSLSLTNTYMHPLFDIYYFNNNDSLVSDITNTELRIGLRFAYRERFMFDNYRRYSLGTQYPKLELFYKQGITDLLGGGFNYRSVEINVWDYFTTASFGGTSYTMRAGKIFGTLPTLLLQTPRGNETYFMNHNNFNLMNEYEFVNDTYAELMVTHSFYGFFLNKIPYVNRLKLREVATFKLAYGSLSERNQQMNDFEKNAPPFYIGNTSMAGKPYMEAGVGIENIFKLVRVDAIWRLTYRNNPLAPNFGVRVGVNLDI